MTLKMRKWPYITGFDVLFSVLFLSVLFIVPADARFTVCSRFAHGLELCRAGATSHLSTRKSHGVLIAPRTWARQQSGGAVPPSTGAESRAGWGFLACLVENAPTWGNAAISAGENLSAMLHVLICIYKK